MHLAMSYKYRYSQIEPFQRHKTVMSIQMKGMIHNVNEILLATCEMIEQTS